MTRLILIIILLEAFGLTMAESPLEVQKLTPMNSKELGFLITLRVNSEGTGISISGPKLIQSNCFPRRMGTLLRDDTGKELIFFSTHPRSVNEVPMADGFFRDKNTTMTVFIDYICNSPNTSSSRRYEIESVAEYIIQSQSINNNAIKKND